MVEQGFTAPRPLRPGTIALVVIGHAAALAAVILAKGPPIVPHAHVIEVYRVKEAPEPPPLPPPPMPHPTTPPSRIDTPKRVIETPPSRDVTLTDLPKLDPTPPTRTIDPPIAPPQPPAHVAIVTDAAPDPRFASGFQPPYPPALQRAEVEGRTVVRVLVGADGRVTQVEIVSADDPAFAEATRRQALRAWRFRPATRDGVAVESWRTLTVHFRMQA